MINKPITKENAKWLRLMRLEQTVAPHPHFVDDVAI